MIIIYVHILYGKVQIYAAGKKFPQMISSHNLLFLKVVWRGHHGVATAKNADSTGKELVSDKTRFLCW